MIPVFPVVELLDRYAIALIKKDRIGTNEEEFNFYHTQVESYDLKAVEQEFQSLIEVHKGIWDLEKELKSGREDLLALDEIGRRAIMIRDKNNQRVKLKNAMAEKLGCSVREIKKDHLSE